MTAGILSSNFGVHEDVFWDNQPIGSEDCRVGHIAWFVQPWVPLAHTVPSTDRPPTQSVSMDPGSLIASTRATDPARSRGGYDCNYEIALLANGLFTEYRYIVVTSLHNHRRNTGVNKYCPETENFPLFLL